MGRLKYVTYCGMYCKLCVNLARIAPQASALKETMRKAGYELFGKDCIKHFKEFWEVLGQLSELDTAGPTCRTGCGNPECKVRACAQEKHIDLCSACEEYPCKHIREVAKQYPNLIADGTRQRQIGLDAWIAEQEQRVAAGFCYDQIRYQ